MGRSVLLLCLPLATSCLDSRRADGNADTACADAAGPSPWYADDDHDGYGSGAPLSACEAPEGHVANEADCDDESAQAWPGASEGQGVCGDGVSSCAPSACRYAGANELIDTSTGQLVGTADPYSITTVSMIGDVDGDGREDIGYGQYVVPGAKLDRMTEIPPGGIRVVSENNAIYRLERAGDVTGDGRDDLLAVGGGARTSWEEPAVAWVLADVAGAGDVERYGSPLHYPLPSFVEGAGVGDRDDDGYDDIVVVGSDRESGSGMWLYRGGPDGMPYEASIAASNPSVTLTNAVSGVGDLDGDGLDDFAIGSRGYSESGVSAGAVWVFTSMPPGDGTIPELADLEIAGQAATYSGSDLDGAGDADGDGYDDLLIGHEPSDRTGVVSLLVASLVLGPIRDDMSVADAHGRFYTDSVGDAFLYGATVTGAGDMNADGLDDFAIGLEREGVVYLYYGARTGVRSVLDADATFSHEWWYSVGHTMDGGADLDGDGLPDLLIANPAWEKSTGMAFIVGGWAP